MKKALLAGAAALALAVALPLMALAQIDYSAPGDRQPPASGSSANSGKNKTNGPPPKGQGQGGGQGQGQDKNKKATDGYEQIPGPWAINAFEKHMQIGNSLWGKPKDLLQLPGRLNAAGLTCLSVAFDTRETALLAVKATQNSADQVSFTARRDCLKAVLTDASTDLLQSLQACNTTYVDARKAAALISQEAAKAAQSQYLAAARKCVLENSETAKTAPEASRIVQALEEPKEIAKPMPLPAKGNPPVPQQPPAKGGVGNDFSPPGQGGTAGGQKTSAQGGKQGKGERPQKALDACSGLETAAACTFTDGDRTV